MPDRVQRAMHRASPNIYAGELVDITKSIIRDLKVIANCSGDVAIYHGNGHAAWEASLCNLFSAGDRILVIDTGRFGEGWALMAKPLGIEVILHELDVTLENYAEDIAQILRRDSDQKIRAVLTVQTDTATSSTNDIKAIRSVIDQLDHPALFMVDAIASFGCEPMDMEAYGVDVLLTASQKGLMTPPGIALMFVRDRVWEYHAKASLNTPYWDMSPRVNPTLFPEHFCGTPPTHHLYGLREALDMILEEGISNVWSRHRAHAECVWAAVSAWSVGGQLKCHVEDSKLRSLAVTAIATAEGDAVRIREWCENKVGVTLGVGLARYNTGKAVTDTIFRIGHMGHLNPPTLLGVLACVDASLKALSIPHGNGALDAASTSISRSLKAD